MSAMDATLEPQLEATYPVRLEIARPEKQSRLTNFPFGLGTFIRFVILVPHLIILYFFQILAGIIYLVGTIAILFTGRYPEGLFRFYAGYLRWTANVYAYFASLYDNYPPFTTDQQEYPLVLEVDYPPRSSRLLNLPIFGSLIKSLLLLPHFIVLFFLIIAAVVVVSIAQLSILFTGSFPQGMHGFVTGVGRWAIRVNCYLVALTDKYPPFSFS